MLGFDAPLTIETKVVLDCPKVLGGGATMRNVSAIARTTLIEIALKL